MTNDKQPPPVPAGNVTGPHMHWSAEDPEQPRFWERMNPNLLIGIVALAALIVGGIIGIFIPNPTQAGTVASCHTAIDLSEDIHDEQSGALALSAEALTAVRDLDYAYIEEIGLGLDEHSGALDVLWPEYEDAKRRCGA